jgi:DNA replication protein DnaC
MKRPLRKTLNARNLAERGVPSDYFYAQLEDYKTDPETYQLFENYMNYLEQMRKDNIGLILYGTNGSGKTFLSSLIIKDAYMKRYTSFRITLQNYLNLQFKKDELSVEKKNAIIDCDFLVIDEVGKETFSENLWNITVFEEMLRHRDSIGRPTIICTNLPLESKDGLYSQYGNSIRSLIEGNYAKVEFDGEDKRPEVKRKKKGIEILFSDKPEEVEGW